MRFFGYGLGSWRRESPVNRARLIAHYLEHNTREAYSAEMHKIALDRDKPKGNAEATDFFQYRQGGGAQ